MRQSFINKHVSSTIALCACSFANAFLLLSLHPYSGYMVMFLIPGTTTETAGSSAGFLVGSFMIGRLITIYQWGRLADRYGRVFVLQVTLLLSALFSILFGMSRSYTMAILWRSCLGMSCSLISTAKTSALEIAHGDEKIERRALGLVMSMRSWAYLIGSAVGGLLAEPVKQYPNITFLQQAPLRAFLEQYPFILPNLLAALVCLACLIAVTFLLEETLPSTSRRSPRELLHCLPSSLCSQTSEIEQAQSGRDAQSLISNLSISNAAPEDDDCDKSEFDIWKHPTTRMHLMVHLYFSVFNSMLTDAVPLFCLSSVAGLGFSASSIGSLLSMAGIILAILQYLTYAWLVGKFGMYKSQQIGCLGAMLPTALMPFSIFLLPRYPRWLVYCYLGVLMAATRVMSSVFLATLSLATNKTVDTAYRNKVNALATFAVSISKLIGAVAAGCLATISYSSSFLGLVPPKYGSAVVFSTIVAIGLCVYIQQRSLERHVDSLEKHVELTEQHEESLEKHELLEQHEESLEKHGESLEKHVELTNPHSN